MASLLAVAGFFTAYAGCGAGALWLDHTRKPIVDRAEKHGLSGESRVHTALTRAGYAVLTDLTVHHGHGTHQIDHIVRGQNRLFVLETKTWYGAIEGRAGDQHWILRRPKSREPLRVYNPLRQNETHAEVIGAITRAPITPVVVSISALTVPADLAHQVTSLPALPALLGPQAPTTRRIADAFNALERRKAAWGQKSLAARHKNWMMNSRKFSPIRALWVASGLSFIGALYTAYTVFSG